MSAQRIRWVRAEIGRLEEAATTAQQAVPRIQGRLEEARRDQERASKALEAEQAAQGEALAAAFIEDAQETPATRKAEERVSKVAQDLAKVRAVVRGLERALSSTEGAVEAAEKDLKIGATRAKRAAAEEIMAEIRGLWGEVRARLAELGAVADSSPHGDPPHKSGWAESEPAGTPFVVAECAHVSIAELGGWHLYNAEIFTREQMLDDAGLVRALQAWEEGDDSLYNADADAGLAILDAEQEVLEAAYRDFGSEGA